MLAIIGGTGLYNIEGIKTLDEIKLETPYGPHSGQILKGEFMGKEIYFLARHGKDHSILPHEVNYQANIWALKKLGTTQIISVSAVGSLKEEIAPGDICVTKQYFDFIKGSREKTFFGQGLVAHISTAEPTCPALCDLIEKSGKNINLDIKTGKTYGCVDGPRLGTRAESIFLKESANCDLVGMTNIPEVFLAREAQICYTTIAIATDYDCWRDDESKFVTLSQVIEHYGKSVDKVKQLLENIMRNTTDINCKCRSSLQDAVITPTEALSNNKLELLSLLKQ